MIERKSFNPFFVLNGILSDMRIKTGLLICCILFTSFYANADTEETIDIELSPVISFDEVPVDFNVNGYLKFETDVIITESNKVYINIEDLFKHLGIKCVSENKGNYLTGFIENENVTYSIDFNARQIKTRNKTINSANGLIKESGAIYIETTLLTVAFGLNAIFNYRSLSIIMDADFELPVTKQTRLEQMRQNVSKLQNKPIIADTILKRNYHFFKFGMMDWFLASFQTKDRITNNRIALGVGAEFLYGQANVSIYYDNKYKFDKKQFYYNWRWVDNEKSIIKQAQLGKIYTQSIAFIESPVVGATVSNAPTTVRKASGYYTINEYTEPNWTIELYINDVLVDYTVADASGLFAFKVPIVYGYTTLKLKFYGPMGEERIEERTRNVPFTFMPDKTLEYRVSGGVLQDNIASRFGQGVVNYGINSFITVGGGMEYLSSIPNSPFIPFATLAIQPFSKMVLNFEYAHNVRTRGMLNYYFGKSAYLEIDYAKYKEGQLATRFNANEEFKIRLSLPFKLKKISGYAKLNFQQFTYSEFTYNYFDAVFSGYYKNFNVNLSTLINWVSKDEPYITSNLSLSYRMRNGLVFRPSAEYNISENRLSRYKIEVEKRVNKTYFSVYYEKDVVSKTDNVFVSVRFNFPFARAGVSASYNNNNLYFTESAEGSLAFGGDNHVKPGNNSSVGKGGILCYPFLDLNQNGNFDEDEHMVLLSSVKVSGGRAIISEKDSIVRIADLNSFVNYIVEFTDADLANIGWRFSHKTYQVLVDPNQFKHIDIPIIALGEASGTVYIKEGEETKGIGRITIQIFDIQGNKVAETLSETDGYFGYLGLKPGQYIACMDSIQLRNLKLTVNPLCRKFTIKAEEFGDIVEGLDFVLNEINDDKIPLQSSVNDAKNVITISELNPQQKLKAVDKAIEGPVYSVQLLALKKQVDINDCFATLISRLPGIQITETKGDDGYFRYSCGKFSSREDALILMNQILNAGWEDCFILKSNSK
jgi:hypothetical protein